MKKKNKWKTVESWRLWRLLFFCSNFFFLISFFGWVFVYFEMLSLILVPKIVDASNMGTFRSPTRPKSLAAETCNARVWREGSKVGSSRRRRAQAPARRKAIAKAKKHLGKMGLIWHFLGGKSQLQWGIFLDMPGVTVLGGNLITTGVSEPVFLQWI